MDVGFGDVRDPQLRRRGGIDVLLHVAIRIDDDRLAGGRAANQVTVLRDQRLKEPFDDHEGV